MRGDSRRGSCDGLFSVDGFDNELSIVRRTPERAARVQQAQLRFEGGLTSETVYQQAKVEYASTATLIPDLESRIEIMEKQYCIAYGKNLLTGRCCAVK